jgi:hypothetical protein
MAIFVWSVILILGDYGIRWGDFNSISSSVMGYSLTIDYSTLVVDPYEVEGTS